MPTVSQQAEETLRKRGGVGPPGPFKNEGYRVGPPFRPQIGQEFGLYPLLRRALPQYSHVGDQALSRALFKRFYADEGVNVDQFREALKKKWGWDARGRKMIGLQPHSAVPESGRVAMGNVLEEIPGPPYEIDGVPQGPTHRPVPAQFGVPEMAPTDVTAPQMGALEQTGRFTGQLAGEIAMDMPWFAFPLLVGAEIGGALSQDPKQREALRRFSTRRVVGAALWNAAGTISAAGRVGQQAVAKVPSLVRLFPPLKALDVGSDMMTKSMIVESTANVAKLGLEGGVIGGTYMALTEDPRDPDYALHVKMGIGFGLILTGGIGTGVEVVRQGSRATQRQFTERAINAQVQQQKQTRLEQALLLNLDRPRVTPKEGDPIPPWRRMPRANKMPEAGGHQGEAVKTGVGEFSEGANFYRGGVGDSHNFFPRSSHPDHEVVFIDPRRMDKAWKGDVGYYVGKAGAGGDPVKFQRFAEFAQTGRPIEMPVASLQIDPAIRKGASPRAWVSFTDGRHRYAWFRDLKSQAVPIMVPAEQAATFRAKFGVRSIYAAGAPKSPARVKTRPMPIQAQEAAVEAAARRPHWRQAYEDLQRARDKAYAKAQEAKQARISREAGQGPELFRSGPDPFMGRQEELQYIVAAEALDLASRGTLAAEAPSRYAAELSAKYGEDLGTVGQQVYAMATDSVVSMASRTPADRVSAESSLQILQAVGTPQHLTRYTDSASRQNRHYQLMGLNAGFSLTGEGEIINVINNSGLDELTEAIFFWAAKSGGQRMRQLAQKGADDPMGELLQQWGFKETKRQKANATHLPKDYAGDPAKAEWVFREFDVKTQHFPVKGKKGQMGLAAKLGKDLLQHEVADVIRDRNPLEASSNWELRKARAVKRGMQQMISQLNRQTVKTEDWYRETVQYVDALMMAAFPATRDGTEMAMWKVLLSVTSNGTNPRDNMNFALKAYRQFARTGKIPVAQDIDPALARAEGALQNVPTKLTTEQVEFGKVGPSLKKLRKLHEQLGSDRAFIDHLYSKRSIKGEFAREVYLAQEAMGPKIGTYWLNLNGIHEQPVIDSWMMRWWHQMMGDPFAYFVKEGHPKQGQQKMVRGKPALKDTPSVEERQLINEAIAEIGKNLTDKGYVIKGPDQVQAPLWYYTKDLYFAGGGEWMPGSSYLDELEHLLVEQGASITHGYRLPKTVSEEVRSATAGAVARIRAAASRSPGGGSVPVK